MGEEVIKKVLKDSGMTAKEAEVYIFLAKHDPLKGTEIAKLIKKDKGQVFYLLKRLQAKGFVESTLDYPTRYTVIPFENILDSLIKTRQREVTFIQEAKKDLLDYLKKKHQTKLQPSLEKFAVIKGNKRIYSKIKQIVDDTRRQLSVIATVPSLLHADQLGIFDVAFNHPLRSQIQYRFLTELSEQNLNAIEALLGRTPKIGFNFRVRNPDLGPRLFPRMITRDNEEMLFFTTPRTGKIGKDDVCLWTNSKTLIQTFKAIFEDLWRNSIEIQEKITEIETGEVSPRTCLIDDLDAAKKKYEEILQSAEEELILMTSSNGLIGYLGELPLFKELSKKGVSVKIMAPIVGENLEAAQKLSKICKVKHIPTDYPEATVVDGKHFFQFKALPTEKAEVVSTPHFENTFYTNDPEYVEKMKNMLDDVWKNARAPSPVTVESILRKTHGPIPPLPARARVIGISIEEQKKSEIVAEKDILDKIINVKKFPGENRSEDLMRLYGSMANAAIHPPDHFNLPDMVISLFHIEKQSAFGEEDAMLIYLWLKTPEGPAYVPAALVGDNPKGHAFWKAWLADSPAGQNVQLIKKEELQIRIHGNTLFAGWTVPIRLFPPDYILPPACLLIEGCGNLKTDTFTMFSPSGYRTEIERSGFEAFVTFFHPSSQYSGPGTDGFFSRDYVATTYPPSNA